MNNSKTKILGVILYLAILSVAVYVFRSPLNELIQYAENLYLPCSRPIVYSIGNFDTRFGLSKKDFLGAIQKAEQRWETPLKKQLFIYSDQGGLTVNLIYDYRQEATQKLHALGIVVRSDESSYNDLKAKYDSLQAVYNQQKIPLESLISAYQAKLSSYEAEVDYWNSRNGAPKAEYDKLQQEKTALDEQLIQINKSRANLNVIVDEINALASVLNKLANELNLTANKYNTIGTKRGGEFEEGQYKSDASGKEIDIYQFDNRDKLIRVLAHELGHALGLDHLNNPKAIMYRLNEGINGQATADDINALKSLCHIK